MAAACLVAADDWIFAAWFVPLLLATVAVRIVVEERHLRSDEEYVRYAESVRYRLLPGVW